MKVQDVKKECLANVGLSIEFSNSEVDSIAQLMWNVDKSIEKNCAELFEAGKDKRANSKSVFDGLYGNDAPVVIDLKTLCRISWLLDKLTMGRATRPSGLFDEADASLITTLDKINGQRPVNEGLV